MGMTAPRLEVMRQTAAAVWRWGATLGPRGQGTLWMPYLPGAPDRGVARSRLVLAGAGDHRVLSLADSATDELDAVGHIARLKDAQTRLRKKGGCVAIGLQSIDQLQAVYGAPIANTIIENCDNKLILRCGASERGGKAQFASDLIGEHEVEHEEATTSHTHAPHGTCTGHSLVDPSARRRTEKAVLPSQILQLRDCACFLTLADRLEWRSVKFAYFDFRWTPRRTCRRSRACRARPA